jgi:hypothetical protein
MPENTEGYEAYGFTSNVPPGKSPRDVVDEIAKQPGIRFVARFAGDFLVFAAAQHGTFEELQTAVTDPYWEAGLRTEWAVMSKLSQIMGPKRGSPDYSAIVRARALIDPEDALKALDARFRERSDADPHHEHFCYGAAIVGAQWDLLVDLGADSHAELERIVRKELRTVEGIELGPAARAFLPNNAKRPGGSSA